MTDFTPFLFYSDVTVALSVTKFHFLPPELLHSLRPLLTAAELLPHGHLLDGLPAALLAVRPDRRHRERRKVIAALYRPAQLNETTCYFTHPACARFYAARTKPHSLPVSEQRLQIFFEKGLVMEDLFGDAVPEKKRGQRKKPLAELIYLRGLDALVSGVSLGRKGSDVDAPQVNVQYAILEREDETHELVEKMYFDHLADFIYVEFMKGLQKGFVPKRCANCGRWFLQEPGLTYSYCAQVAPGETELTCRDIGSRASFRDKVKNNEIWQIHQRAYKKYFARTKKGTMSKTDFEAWAREAEELRDQVLKKYKKTKEIEERDIIVKTLEKELNRI